ncbi:MAG: gluconokinase [Ferruginibacter sp.]
MANIVIYIMGVSGTGKTTIGTMLAERTGYAFYDADNFHPPANIDKMKSGQPLTDEDRWPWLDNINTFITKELVSNSVIMACSALKTSYRLRLGHGIESQCRWVFLNGDYNTIYERLQKRSGHYMPLSLLKSQFEVLEIPLNAIKADITQSPGTIIDYIISKLEI